MTLPPYFLPRPPCPWDTNAIACTPRASSVLIRPFLDQVRRHDPVALRERAYADPGGFPWLDV